MYVPAARPAQVVTASAAALEVSCGAGRLGTIPGMTTIRRLARQAWRHCTRAFWGVDRALGGLERPSRTQQFAARRPLAVGVWMATPVTVLLGVANLDSLDTVGDVVLLLGGGLAFGLLFGLTALGERARQRRLRRLGLWEPPVRD